MLRTLTLFMSPVWAQLQAWGDAFPWLVPVIQIAGGLLLGLIVEKLVLGRLRRIAARTPSQLDDVFVDSLRGMPLLWLFLAGLFAASDRLADFAPHWVNLTNRTLLVIFLLSLTLSLSRLLSGLVAVFSSQSEGLLPSTSIFRNLATLLAVTVGGLVILDTLGISITPVLTALGVGGLAVALALQDTLSNLFAGLSIIASRQVRVGDYIKLTSGEEGFVTDIRWGNTTIRTLPNNQVLIPNKQLASAVLTNYHQPSKDMAVRVQVGVSYGSDLEKVEKVTIEVGREVMRTVQGGVPEFEPFIRYHTFGESSIQFTVILRGQEFTDQYLVTHEFIKRLQRRYAQEGIEIPFPIRTVHLKSESKS
jgi:small-conductance mechanosensitive channel